MLNRTRQSSSGNRVNAISCGFSEPAFGAVLWTVINTLLTGLLILLTPGPSLTLLMGGCAIALAAITGANVARRRMQDMMSPTPLDVLTIWLPGLVGLVLAIAGLVLVLRYPGQRPLQLGGIALFLIQILLIAVPGAERMASPSNRSPSGRSA